MERQVSQHPVALLLCWEIAQISFSLILHAFSHVGISKKALMSTRCHGLHGGHPRFQDMRDKVLFYMITHSCRCCYCFTKVLRCCSLQIESSLIMKTLRPFSLNLPLHSFPCPYFFPLSIGIATHVGLPFTHTLCAEFFNQPLHGFLHILPSAS